MVSFYKSTLVFFSFICTVGIASAQPSEPADPLKRYLDAFGKTLLYHGKQYVVFPSNTTGHQGYKTNSLTEGCTIRFQGLIFGDIPLMYDLVRDEVVTRHPDRFLPMILSREFVSLFTIEADTFVHLKAENTGLPSGYYHQLFHARDVSCYAKRSKTIKTYNLDLESTYVEYVRFYIKESSDSAFRPIRNQRALLNTYSDKKRELRRLLHANGLSFRQDPEQTITFVLTYVTD